MNCRECTEFLIDYHAGELPADVAAAFDGHLAKCGPCVDYVRHYARTIALEKAAFRSGGAGALPDIPEELVQAILAARGGRA
jgi:anti-sigma factor RsiW